MESGCRVPYVPTISYSALIQLLTLDTEAMDRIHRLGQHRPVEAIKLVIEDSIESRIVQLQEKKSAMINATLSTDDSAMGRLTPDDVSCMIYNYMRC